MAVNRKRWLSDRIHDLVSQILDVCEYSIDDVRDIHLVGSYLFGTPTEQSDIDAVVWVNAVDRHWARSGLFGGKKLSIKIKPYSDYDKPNMWGSYHLPRKSLLTGQTDPGNIDDVVRYLDKKRRK